MYLLWLTLGLIKIAHICGVWSLCGKSMIDNRLLGGTHIAVATFSFWMLMGLEDVVSAHATGSRLLMLLFVFANTSRCVFRTHCNEPSMSSAALLPALDAACVLLFAVTAHFCHAPLGTKLVACFSTPISHTIVPEGKLQ